MFGRLWSERKQVTTFSFDLNKEMSCFMLTSGKNRKFIFLGETKSDDQDHLKFHTFCDADVFQ